MALPPKIFDRVEAKLVVKVEDTLTRVLGFETPSGETIFPSPLIQMKAWIKTIESCNQALQHVLQLCKWEGGTIKEWLDYKTQLRDKNEL